MTEFVSLEFALSFAGMLICVNIMTQVTKGLFDKLFCNRTKYVVAAYSFLFAIFAAIWTGDFSSAKSTATTCIVWIINSSIIWLAAMKGYEEVRGNGQE